MSAGHNEFIPSARIFLFPLYKPAFKTVMAVTWRHWRHVHFLTSCPFPWTKTQKLGNNVHFMFFVYILQIQMTVNTVIERILAKFSSKFYKSCFGKSYILWARYKNVEKSNPVMPFCASWLKVTTTGSGNGLLPDGLAPGHSGYGLSQLREALQCNAFSHWQGSNPEWSLEASWTYCQLDPRKTKHQWNLNKLFSSKFVMQSFSLK